jgi:hypothetical protein
MTSLCHCPTCKPVRFPIVYTVNSHRKLRDLNGAHLFNNMPAGKWAKSGRVSAPARREMRCHYKDRGWSTPLIMHLNAQQRRDIGRDNKRYRLAMKARGEGQSAPDLANDTF